MMVSSDIFKLWNAGSNTRQSNNNGVLCLLGCFAPFIISIFARSIKGKFSFWKHLPQQIGTYNNNVLNNFVFKHPSPFVYLCFHSSSSLSMQFIVSRTFSPQLPLLFSLLYNHTEQSTRYERINLLCANIEEEQSTLNVWGWRFFWVYLTYFLLLHCFTISINCTQKFEYIGFPST